MFIFIFKIWERKFWYGVKLLIWLKSLDIQLDLKNVIKNFKKQRKKVTSPLWFTLVQNSRKEKQAPPVNLLENGQPPKKM